jgi:hypothetical protein
MPNYDQTGPNGQGSTGRRGQLCQAGNQNTNTDQDNSVFNALRRRLRSGNTQGEGRGQGRRKGGGRGNCRCINNRQ